MKLHDFYPQLQLFTEVKGITADSRKVKDNYIFVAVKGKKYNGKNFIKNAIRQGACFIVSEHHLWSSVPHLKVENAKKEYVRLLQKFYHYRPDIYTIGVTGTDGKTTTATMMHSILNGLIDSAYIGTNGISYLGKNVPSKNTTPGPELLYASWNIFRKYHIHDLVMEVSSEGILDGRVDHFQFNGAIYTNLSCEHLNTHKNMDEYFKCKAHLFEAISKDGLIAINTDDYYAHFIKFYTSAHLITYGISTGSYQAKNIQMDLEHSEFDVYYLGKFLDHIRLSLFGQYNIYNALGCIAYCHEYGIDLPYIKKGLELLKSVDGRFMHFTNHQDITGIVDFAHTPNALKNLLSDLLPLKKNKMILILGAAGEKDRTKRAEMGKIATHFADITIFTSEDPKNENLFQIFLDLTENLQDKEYYLTLSRKDAIKLAVSLAEPKDFIIITGKGNEQTEQIMNFTFQHNDYRLLYSELTKINDRRN